MTKKIIKNKKKIQNEKIRKWRMKNEKSKIKNKKEKENEK